MVKPINPPHPAVLLDVNKYKIPYPLVEVVWDDASSNSESWVNLKDIQPPEQVITIGWLVLDVPGPRGYVTIASSLSNEELHEDVVGNTMTIPRGMIVRQRTVALRELKPKIVKVVRRDTFEVPEGMEAVRDGEGRATGELKPKAKA